MRTVITQIKDQDLRIATKAIAECLQELSATIKELQGEPDAQSRIEQEIDLCEIDFQSFLEFIADSPNEHALVRWYAKTMIGVLKHQDDAPFVERVKSYVLAADLEASRAYAAQVCEEKDAIVERESFLPYPQHMPTVPAEYLVMLSVNGPNDDQRFAVLQWIDDTAHWGPQSEYVRFWRVITVRHIDSVVAKAPRMPHSMAVLDDYKRRLVDQLDWIFHELADNHDPESDTHTVIATKGQIERWRLLASGRKEKDASPALQISADIADFRMLLIKIANLLSMAREMDHDRVVMTIRHDLFESWRQWYIEGQE